MVLCDCLVLLLINLGSLLFINKLDLIYFGNIFHLFDNSAVNFQFLLDALSFVTVTFEISEVNLFLVDSIITVSVYVTFIAFFNTLALIHFNFFYGCLVLDPLQLNLILIHFDFFAGMFLSDRLLIN